MNRQGEICFLFGMAVLLLCYFCVERLNRDRLLIKTKYPCNSCVIETHGLSPETLILAHSAERKRIAIKSNGNRFNNGMENIEIDTPHTPQNLFQKQQKDEVLPELVVDNRYIPVEEILRNASVIRFDYYSNLSYPFVLYHKGDSVCNTTIKRIPCTTDVVRNRKLLTINTR